MEKITREEIKNWISQSIDFDYKIDCEGCFDLMLDDCWNNNAEGDYYICKEIFEYEFKKAQHEYNEKMRKESALVEK